MRKNHLWDGDLSVVWIVLKSFGDESVRRRIIAEGSYHRSILGIKDRWANVRDGIIQEKRILIVHNDEDGFKRRWMDERGEECETGGSREEEGR